MTTSWKPMVLMRRAGEVSWRHVPQDRARATLDGYRERGWTEVVVYRVPYPLRSAEDIARAARAVAAATRTRRRNHELERALRELFDAEPDAALSVDEVTARIGHKPDRNARGWLAHMLNNLVEDGTLTRRQRGPQPRKGPRGYLYQHSGYKPPRRQTTRPDGRQTGVTT